jgi:hypothetical protein
MKLTVMTQVTVDGVGQGNGSASDEDRRNGFERGGWARGAGDDETRTLITRTYQRADAFLFGRRTYELFAGSWGAIEEMRAHPIGVALNETPKYADSKGGDDLGLPARGAPAVCRRLKRVTQPPSWAAGRVPALWPGPIHAGNEPAGHAPVTAIRFILIPAGAPARSGRAGSGQGGPEFAQDGRCPGRVLEHPPVAEPVEGGRPGAGPDGAPGRRVRAHEGFLAGDDH